MRIAGVAISEVRGRHPGADEEWVAQLLASASVSTASGPSEADYVDDHGDSFNRTYVAVYGCSDPVADGHVEPSVKAVHNGRQTSGEEAKAERQRVLRNNKAWRTAEGRSS